MRLLLAFRRLRQHPGFSAALVATLPLGLGATTSLFPLLRVAQQLGRHLGPEEEEPGADAVVVLSDGLWRRRFGANRAVVGHAVHLDGRSCVVVGVMPPGFEFPHPSFRFGRRAGL